MQSAIGIDIGGTKISAGIVQLDGGVIAPRTVPTPYHDADEVISATIALCKDTLDVANSKKLTIHGIGIGTAGQVDTQHGTITYGNANIPGWTGKPIAELVSSALKLPVLIDNDVNVLAVSEGRYGSGRDFQHILYLTVGTGIGGAIVLNGQIWRGAHFSAGEIGYLVANWDEDGQPVSIEKLAAGKGIERQYHLQGGENLDLRAIAGCAKSGDGLAQQVIEDGARLLGEVLCPVICLIDPEIVIVGGGVPEIGDLWWSPFETAIRNYPLPATQKVVLSRAKLRVHAGVIGAGLLALEGLA
ncbi:MAG: ROK family protein [Aggregatilineales bacterium]